MKKLVAEKCLTVHSVHDHEDKESAKQFLTFGYARQNRRLEDLLLRITHIEHKERAQVINRKSTTLCTSYSVQNCRLLDKQDAVMTELAQQEALCVKRRLLPLVLVGLIALPSAGFCAPPEPQVCESRALDSGIFRAYADPKPVSGHAFTTNGGKKINLDSLPGPRALLVNFWTTWCTPCKKEMPSMDRLQGRISVDELLILPLVRDGKGSSEAVRFYRTHDIKNLPIAADRFGKISHQHHIGPVPQTLFVDQQGLVKGILVGGVDWESKPVLELLNHCLNVKVE